MQKNSVIIAPSIMSADLCNLETSIKALEKEGLDTLHIDIIDGAFSPSMPLGIDTVKQMRKLTDMQFDVHLMTNDNEFFIQEMIDIGVEQISFHLESSMHTDRYLNLIKNSGAKAGVALNPTTPLSTLDYLLPQCDTVLLMLINPGFATFKSEKQVPYAAEKVQDLYELIQRRNLQTQIEVDGRVSMDSIATLVEHGADTLVAGSTSLFMKDQSVSENKQTMEQHIQAGLSRRKVVNS
ncbi:ribulose-phosphate 3-epimerase [Bacillus daqingensis]|uniref:Ribulose-phosphate 3-epimerase n=1 Tax=Bacillus daqingensis TaxID=872396 RepID=A0ABV9NXR3_9BACI